jgi:alkylation response protein AidB-like acyl-CoA dehydrogenase
MQLALSENQRLIRDSFESFFKKEVTSQRVRAAENSGVDEALWQGLVELGAPVMRVSAEHGGSELSLLDAVLIAEAYGRYLAPVPLLEAIVCARVLGVVGETELLEAVASGKKRVTFIPQAVVAGDSILVPSIASASVVLALCGYEIQVFELNEAVQKADNLGDAAIALWQVPTTGRSVKADVEDPVGLFQGAIEEWKLLTASAMVGAAQMSMQLASEYANEREAFGQLIGTYQGISHPLAESATDIDGARLLVWRAVAGIAYADVESASLVSQSWWWAATSSALATHKAVRTLGGYGLAMEYDPQLYLRRVKTWALMLGDPEVILDEAASRLWCGKKTGLPPTGEVEIDFSLGEKAQASAERVRAFFDANLTPELKLKSHHSTSCFDAEFHRKMAADGIIYADWPVGEGGQALNAYDAHAMSYVFEETNWSSFLPGITNMVAGVVRLFGSDRAKAEILPKIKSGDVICSLGFSEPSCGSDVFAARTTAVRNGDNWVVNGQKMFTTGAHKADYVLMLTRTDSEARKHKGITLFLLPLKSEGVEIHKVETLMSERTNITYYQDVEVPDYLRLGDVNGGAQVMLKALETEHSGSGYHVGQVSLWQHAMAWSRAEDHTGKCPIDDARIRRGLARVATRINVSEVLMLRSLWASADGVDDGLFGSKSKLFASESYVTNSWELMQLAAPYSLFKGRDALGQIEQAHRRSFGTTIYGGTSEVHRSRIAEEALGLPRTRG